MSSAMLSPALAAAEKRQAVVDAGIEVLEGAVLEGVQIADPQQFLVLARLLIAQAALARDQSPEVGVGDRRVQAQIARATADRAGGGFLTKKRWCANAGTFRDRTFQRLEDVPDAPHVHHLARRSPIFQGWHGCSASCVCCS